MMIPAERQQRILHALRRRGVVSINELIGEFDVSHMTVRRDVQALEDKGLVIVVSGGVQLAERITSEPSHSVKTSIFFEEKRAIAREAVTRVRPGSSVYLDAGTTCLAIAEEISLQPELAKTLLVVTNAFPVAELLMRNSTCRLYHTGGFVLKENQSCTGDMTARFISSLNIDTAFISGSSWGPQWLSTPSEEKVSVKLAAVQAAADCILVCDSTKYGKVGFFNIVKLSDLQEVITDSRLGESARSHLSRTGVRVTAVGEF